MPPYTLLSSAALWLLDVPIHNQLGHCCYVIAPSLIPKKPGEKIKTDKRDALRLAKLLKSEELTPIWPEPEDKCIRDLSEPERQR